MDEQPTEDQTPQTTPAEVSVPAIATPALPVVQNEAIEVPTTESAPTASTPQIVTLAEPLREAIIRPHEINAPKVDPVTPTPQTEPALLPKALHTVPDVAVKARAAIQSKKRKKLDLMLEEVRKKGSISNNEVEKLLGVSDATASRYLATLQKEGVLKRLGNTGKAVRYQIE